MSAAQAVPGTTAGTDSQQTWPAGKRLIDLSMPIGEHWRFAPEIDYRSTVSAGQPFQSTYFSCRAHAFTHVDAPWHVDPDGADLGAVDLSRLWGEASVIDVSELGDDARLDEAQLSSRAGSVRDGDIVLIRTDHDQRHPTTEREYWSAAPWLDGSGARWLRDRGARAVGFDFPQDRATRAPYVPDYEQGALDDLADEWATHRELLAHGIPLIEYLTNLSAIETDRITVVLLPLNFPRSDGAPVRAVAFD